ncbi:MAG: hypothetical protein ACRCXC_02370 [Legionella sp.]
MEGKPKDTAIPPPKKKEEEAPKKKEEAEDTFELSAPGGTPKVDDLTTKMKAKSAAEQEAEAKAKQRNMQVQGEELNKMLKAFKDKFKDDPFYKKQIDALKDPKPGDKLSLSFKNDQDMASFFHDEAKNGRKFIMVDGASGKVIGYSDGKDLYKAAPGKEPPFARYDPDKDKDKPFMPAPKEMEKMPKLDGFKIPDKPPEPVVEGGPKLGGNHDEAT